MPNTVEEYLSGLPPARRDALTALREVILDALPQGYEEGIQYGSIGYYVPHHLCPDGYHTDPTQPVPFVGLSSKKSFMTLNFFGLYVDKEAKEQFVSAWNETGLKLDMGASCIRFKKLEQVPLGVVGEAVASLSVQRFMNAYEAIIPEKARKKRTGWTTE